MTNAIISSTGRSFVVEANASNMKEYISSFSSPRTAAWSAYAAIPFSPIMRSSRRDRTSSSSVFSIPTSCAFSAYSSSEAGNQSAASGRACSKSLPIYIFVELIKLDFHDISVLKRFRYHANKSVIVKVAIGDGSEKPLIYEL